MATAIDMTGRTYGQLTVLSRAASGGTKVKWLCICECGNHTKVDGFKLRSGHTQTCGCANGLGSKRHPTKGMRFCRTCGRLRAKAKRDRLLQEKKDSAWTS